MYKKLFSYMIFICILVVTLGGCTNGTSSSSDTTQSAASVNTTVNTTASTTSVNTTAENTTEDTTEAPKAETVDIVDMAGRTVKVPTEVNKVVPYTPRAHVLIFTLNPDKLAAWNYKLTDEEKKYINSKYHDLPMIGGSGDVSFNLEEAAKINPEVIVYSGSIDDKAKEDVEKLQSQLNIPVVMVSTKLMDLPEIYDILGKACGDAERGEKLSTYCKDSLKYFEDKGNTISDDKKVRVYYAEGAEGLESEPQSAERISALIKVGAKNVVEAGPNEGSGKMQISFEQLAAWNPDVILIGTDKGQESEFYKTIFDDENWKTLSAVENKQVIVTPFGPFNWFDRPYSVNRILGGYWLGKALYPEVYTEYDLKDKMKEFYKEFYWYDLTDEECDVLLKSALY